jgi:hypothetical protein
MTSILFGVSNHCSTLELLSKSPEMTKSEEAAWDAVKHRNIGPAHHIDKYYGTPAVIFHTRLLTKASACTVEESVILAHKDGLCLNDKPGGAECFRSTGGRYGVVYLRIYAVSQHIHSICS